MIDDDDFDEEELQKRELERLLGTAKNKGRRDLIENALSTLDHQRVGSANSPFRPQNHISALHPTSHPQFFGHGIQKNIMDLKSGTAFSKTRPMSAQRRRPSLTPNLDIIPENISLARRDNETESLLTVEDYNNIFTSSSTDLRFNPKFVVDTHNPNVKRKIWIATGLLPQFMTIILHEKWLLRKIEIKCRGVESFSVYFDGLQEAITVIRENSDAFIINLSNEEHSSLATRKLTVKFTRASQIFFSVNEVKIKALPYI